MRAGALIAAGLLAQAAYAQAPAAGPAAKVFAGLAGSCWRGEPSPEATIDTHCFTLAFNGELAMDVHKVTKAGKVIYEGVTVYRPDTPSGLLAYGYYNSFGDLMTGYAQRAGDELRFPKAPGAEPEMVWKVGKSSYEMTPRGSAKAVRFTRIGPASGGL